MCFDTSGVFPAVIETTPTPSIVVFGINDFVFDTIYNCMYGSRRPIEGVNDPLKLPQLPVTSDSHRECNAREYNGHIEQFFRENRRCSSIAGVLRPYPVVIDIVYIIFPMVWVCRLAYHERDVQRVPKEWSLPRLVESRHRPVTERSELTKGVVGR